MGATALRALLGASESHRSLQGCRASRRYSTHYGATEPRVGRQPLSMFPVCLFLSHELQGKHFLQGCKNCCESTGGDTSKPPNEALAVDCAHLIKRDKS